MMLRRNPPIVRLLVLALVAALLFGSAYAQERGGTATILLSEDLQTMNPYLTTAFNTLQVSPAIIEPLVAVDPEGQYYPVLASEVPSPENGGVSEDGLSVTWNLKQGVTWSDGEPFTADDVVFTFRAASDSASGSVRTAAYSKVVSVEAVDDHTVVVTYNEFDSSYLDAFQWGILPEHATGDPADMANWNFNRNPVGTGPFVLESWRTGDRIVTVRNENFREEGQPYLDGAVFLIVPAQETSAAMMLRGDADVMLWPGTTLRETFDEAENVSNERAPSIWILRMFLNLGERGNPVEDQAPHAILGDIRVRQALAYGIDYDLIIDELAGGKVTRAESPFELGWYACEVDGYSYDPERAAALLEEAGWVDTDGDGIREAQGAPYAEDGTELRLEMVGYTDFRLLEQTELVIKDLLADIGVHIDVRNVEMGVLFGGWSDNAIRKTGDYDILMYDTGAGINPQLHAFELLHSSRIPREENEGAGGNYSRYSNPAVDQALEIAGVSASLEVRREAYCAAAEEINEDVPQIYLYQFEDGHAVSERLQNFQVSTWGSLVWNIEDWWIQ